MRGNITGRIGGEMNFSELNDRNLAERTKQYAYNECVNWPRIAAEASKHPMSVSSLPALWKTPALIVGSGPTLDDAIPHFNQFNGVIFCSISQINILEKWGIAPDFVVALDSADDAADILLDEHSNLSSSILLTFPGISPRILERWPSRVRYFRLIGDPLDEARFPWIDTQFPMLGSVNNTEVIIANFFHCDPIVLAGVDYCFPGGRTRAQDYRRRGPYIFEPKLLQYAETEEGKTTSSEEQLFYANILLAFWKAFKMNLVQVGDRGAMEEIPRISVEDLARPIVVPALPENFWSDVVDKDMIAMGLYANVQGSVVNLHYKDRDKEIAENLYDTYLEANKWAEFWRDK